METHSGRLRGGDGAQTSSVGAAPQAPVTTADVAESHPLYVKVHVRATLKVSALKPGQVVHGIVAEPVYSGSSELFPAGSAVSMKVERTQRRRRPPNDHWPWEIKLFTPRHENYPIFESGLVSTPAGSQVRLHLSLISIERERHVRISSARKKSNGGVEQTQSNQNTGSANARTQKAFSDELTFTFEAAERDAPRDERAGNGSSPTNSLSAAAIQDLAVGEHAKIVLLDPLTASKGRPGERFRARVIAPVTSGGIIIVPEGSLLEGHIARVVPPRWLSRSGSLLLNFDGLMLAGSKPASVSASIVGIDLDRRSHTKIDSEGVLRGAHPGKLWTLINLGTTGGIAKVSDDGLQLVIEAVVSTATDVSTAGTGRIAASCASAIFMITRHGRDVVLPKYTEMNIVFNRSVAVPESHANTTAMSIDAASGTGSTAPVLP